MHGATSRRRKDTLIPDWGPLLGHLPRGLVTQLKHGVPEFSTSATLHLLHYALSLARVHCSGEIFRDDLVGVYSMKCRCRITRNPNDRLRVRAQLTYSWIYVPVDSNAPAQIRERPRLAGPGEARTKVVAKFLPIPRPLIPVRFHVLNTHLRYQTCGVSALGRLDIVARTCDPAQNRPTRNSH